MNKNIGIDIGSIPNRKHPCDGYVITRDFKVELVDKVSVFRGKHIYLLPNGEYVMISGNNPYMILSDNESEKNMTDVDFYMAMLKCEIVTKRNYVMFYKCYHYIELLVNNVDIINNGTSLSSLANENMPILYDAETILEKLKKDFEGFSLTKMVEKYCFKFTWSRPLGKYGILVPSGNGTYLTFKKKISEVRVCHVDIGNAKYFLISEDNLLFHSDEVLLCALDDFIGLELINNHLSLKIEKDIEAIGDKINMLKTENGMLQSLSNISLHNEKIKKLNSELNRIHKDIIILEGQVIDRIVK